ncbi:MAG: hypothetical protein IIB60_00235 [Planctomycetes bacterium]|nr:hypothetical protein [Planctomycetota bacterium]
MALVHQRVILKPPGLSGDDCAKLAERLAEAVAWQQELAAKSPHVLQLTGSLSESDSAFTVEHEPATPLLEPSALFDASATKCDEESLLNTAAALFDALRVAHATQRKRLRAHGGLCLGVLLRSDDGIEKITDFGIVPAVFSAIGTEAYLNLAVRPVEEGPPEVLATGAWEVLDPDEFDREDRLCAFVDPEKYGLARHEGFEPGSDAIAAGFILHLMAEHVHAYLPDADAHRMVEMSEIMAAYRYNGARRQELRESTNPAIATWCDLVGKLLARLPQNRPTSEELVTSLGQYVKAVDIGEILRRRLKTAEPLVEKKAWTELRAAVKDFVEAQDAPADVVERANELLRLANANLLLDRAVEVLKGDDWRDAKEPLDGVLALPAVPAPVAQRTKKAIAVLEHNLAVVSEIEEIKTRTQQDDGSDLAQTRTLLEKSVARAKELAADQSSLPPVQAESAQVHDELAARLETVVAELEKLEAQQRAEAERLEREREEDRKVAEAWFADLGAAVEGEDWDILQEFLDKRPDLKHWPEALDSRVAEVEKRLSDHLAEQERLAAIEADRNTAQAWIAGVREIADAERWEDAQKALSDKPRLTHWPEDVETQARELAETLTAQIHKVAIEADRNTAEAWIATARQAVESEQWEQAEQALADKPQITFWPEDVETQRRELTECVKVAQQRQADFDRARQWHGELKEQIDNKEWGKAADVLSGRPALEYWPEDVLEDEARYRSEIEAQMEAAELEQRQIAAWLEAANATGRDERFEEALRMLDAPPIDADRIPKKIRKQVKTLRESFAAARAQQIKRLVEDRSKAVFDLAETFARNVVSEELHAFLDPNLLRATVSNEQFDGPDEFTECTATLAIELNSPAASTEDRAEAPVTFRRDGDSLRIQGESGLKKTLLGHLNATLAKHQKAALIELAKPLQQGAFPKTKLSVKLGGLEEKVKATVCLLGAKSPTAKIETNLTWAPDSLTWKYDDAEAFVQQTLIAAAAAAQETLAANIPKGSEPLLRYQASLATEVVPVGPANRTSVPDSLSFEARLLIQPRGADAPTQLHTFPVECPKIGEVSPQPDTGPAVAALDQLVAAAQSGSRAGLQDELMKRVGEAAVKIKLKALPKRITSPVDDVHFELSRKRHDPVTLTASWSADQFSYDPTGSSAGKSWDDALGGILAPPTGREKRSALMPIAVAAVVLIAAGGGGYAFWNTRATQERVVDADTGTTRIENRLEGEMPAGTDENDNTGLGNGSSTAPIKPPVVEEEPEPSAPSTIEGVNETRAVLGEFRPLRRHLARLIVEPGDEGTEAPTITYRLPGLPDREWVVTLERSETDPDGDPGVPGPWLLSEQDKQEMQDRVDELRELLEPSSESQGRWNDLSGAITAAVDGSRYTALLDSARLSYRLDDAPSWQLRTDGWETGDTAGRINYAGMANGAGGGDGTAVVSVAVAVA